VNCDSSLSLLIDKIKRDKGLDLSGYKESTLSRRIERRIKFDGALSLEEYMQMIDRDYHLYWRLVSDFFIGVTDFFRDKKIWDVVQEKVLPQIIANKASGEGPLRIWSAGCSSGEETYSLAITVREVLRKTLHDSRFTNHEPPVFIYGTDIMEDKLEIAKEGIYSEEKLKGMDDNLKFRYFEQIADNEEPSLRAPKGRSNLKSYMLDANTKRLARFRKYDLTKPETLTGFDMIVCRNVLIYFQRCLQEKVLKNFHRALREGGILWLGTAESLSGEMAKLFEPIYKNEKIFRKV